MSEDAQRRTTYVIDGKPYDRVPMREGDQEQEGKCYDCAILIGQLHVPGCDVEECPKCGEQVISCGCVEEFRPYEPKVDDRVELLWMSLKTAQGKVTEVENVHDDHTGPFLRVTILMDHDGEEYTYEQGEGEPRYWYEINNCQEPIGMYKGE